MSSHAFSRAVTGGTGNWGWVSAWAVTGGTGVNGLSTIKYHQPFYDVKKSTFFHYLINLKQDADKFHLTTSVIRKFNSNLESGGNKKLFFVIFRSCSVSLEP